MIWNLKIFYWNLQIKVELRLLISDLVAFKVKGFTHTFRADFIVHQKLFLEFLIHLPLTCGALHAFYVNSLLVIQFSQVKARQSRSACSWNVEAFLQFSCWKKEIDLKYSLINKQRNLCYLRIRGAKLEHPTLRVYLRYSGRRTPCSLIFCVNVWNGIQRNVWHLSKLSATNGS